MVLASGMLLAAITSYPVAGDRGLIKPRTIEASPRVEAATDRGPIVEMIVRCPQGTAIISYSKVERVYCSPNLACDRSLQAIVTQTCR